MKDTYEVTIKLRFKKEGATDVIVKSGKHEFNAKSVELKWTKGEAAKLTVELDSAKVDLSHIIVGVGW